MTQNNISTQFFNPVAGTKDNINRVFSLKRIELAEELYSLLIPIMNLVHDAQLSPRFWRFVLGDYVNSIISRKPLIEKEDLKISPEVYPSISFSAPTFKESVSRSLISIMKNLRSRSSKKSINNTLKKFNELHISFPDIKEVNSELGVRLFDFHLILMRKGEVKKREIVKKIALEQDKIFYRNSILLLPKVHIEHFYYIYNSIHLHNPKLKIFHVHVMNTLYNTILVAKYIENGAKLYWYQHGAYYGEMIGHNGHYREHKLADEYRTWGWKIKPKDKPWKAYRLIKFKNDFEKAPQQIKYDLLLCFPDIFEANQSYFEEAVSFFLKNLKPEKFKTILARPRPLNKIQDHQFKVSFIKDSRVTKDNGLSSMVEVIKQSRLIVQFTIPSTNFFECLCVDYPSIGLLENDQPTDAANPFYEYLLEKNVLHLTIESMVDHLNAVDINLWWSELIKEKKYQAFKAIFLNIT